MNNEQVQRSMKHEVRLQVGDERRQASCLCWRGSYGGSPIAQELSGIEVLNVVRWHRACMVHSIILCICRARVSLCAYRCNWVGATKLAACADGREQHLAGLQLSVQAY